jgi:hypothetical protein
VDRVCNGCAKVFFLIFISSLQSCGYFYQQQQVVSEFAKCIGLLETAIPWLDQGIGDFPINFSSLVITLPIAT